MNTSNRLIHIIAFAWLSLIALSLPLRLSAAPVSLLEGMSSRVETAAQTGNDSGLTVELAKCEGILGEHPGTAGALYYKAWILLNRASQGGDGDKDQVKALYENAIVALEEAQKAGDNPEIVSLYAAALERSLSVRSAIAAMTLGPKASGLHTKASTAAPDNPRVALLLGTSLMHRPAFAGGSTEKALEQFRKAEALFKTSVNQAEETSWQPRWGRAEVYAWIGQAELKLGHGDAARAAYEEALRIQPEYRWVKYVLLPALERR